MCNYVKLVLTGFCQLCCWTKVVYQVHKLVLQVINLLKQFGAAKDQLESIYNHLKMALAGFYQSFCWSKVVYNVKTRSTSL